jgi:hypothetical protein
MSQYAALSKSPRALADGLMLVFKHLAKGPNISKRKRGSEYMGRQ